MDAWTDWDAARIVLALVALLYAGLWIQVSLMHWAGGFAMRAMWGPVISSPLVVGATAAAVVDRSDPWGWVAAGLLGLAVLQGLYGTYRHLKGIRSQIGGFSKRNFLSGPPPMLPVAYAVVGVVGLVALLVDA